MLFTGAKLQKNTVKAIFFPKKFARFKKKPYLCTRKSEMTRNLLQ
jgi:hypothetical protein